MLTFILYNGRLVLYICTVL